MDSVYACNSFTWVFCEKIFTKFYRKPELRLSCQTDHDFEEEPCVAEGQLLGRSHRHCPLVGQLLMDQLK